MAADPAGSVIADILVSADRWKGLEISGREWTTRTERARRNSNRHLRSGERSREKENEHKEENEEEVTGRSTEAASDEPTQVFGDLQTLSDEQIDTGNHLCARDVHLGSGMMAENSHGYPMADEILFDRYIYEKTGNCVRPLEDGSCGIRLEYILCGKGPDRENLEGTAARLLLIREASNCAYLFSDEGRMGQVHFVAAAAALIMMNPELEEVLSNALALAWSYLESVQDVRILMTGGRVPLTKTSESWQTELYELLNPMTAIRDRDSGEGIEYSDYLQGLLILKGEHCQNTEDHGRNGNGCTEDHREQRIPHGPLPGRVPHAGRS